jgi:hypothetical protein
VKPHIPHAKPSITELEVRYATDAAANGWCERCYAYIERFENSFKAHPLIAHYLSVQQTQLRRIRASNESVALVKVIVIGASAHTISPPGCKKGRSPPRFFWRQADAACFWTQRGYPMPEVGLRKTHPKPGTAP